MIFSIGPRCWVLSSPCVAGSKILAHLGNPLSPHDTTVFRQTIGALQYCTNTPPDISFAVNQLCQHMHQSTSGLWMATKRVLRDLKGTASHGLWHTKGKIHLQAFVILIGWVIMMTAGLLLIMASSWAHVLFLGLLRNNSLLLGQALRQNIGLQPSLPPNYIGCACCSMTCRFPFPLHQL